MRIGGVPSLSVCLIYESGFDSDNRITINHRFNIVNTEETGDGNWITHPPDAAIRDALLQVGGELCGALNSTKLRETDDSD